MNLKSRKIRFVGKILFILYICFIVYFLIFSEWYGRVGTLTEYQYNLEFMREIKRFWEYRDQLGFYAMFTNIFGNVLIFLPFGFFLPMASKYRSFFAAIFYSFTLSMCVETFQFLSKVGRFDVDDLFLNTVGGAIGYIIFVIGVSMRRRHGNQKLKNRNRRN